jgi:hypothetical protein
MIATRLHAKRHSGSTLNRSSITSIHNTSHHHINQQSRRTSKRSSDDIQSIDSDNNEDINDAVHEGTKVENISYSF